MLKKFNLNKKSQIGYFPKLIFLILLFVIVFIIVFKTQQWFFTIEKVTFQKYADIEALDIADSLSGSPLCLAYQQNQSNSKILDVFLLDENNEKSLACARSFLRTNGVNITLDSCKGYEFPKEFYQRCDDDTILEEISSIGSQSTKLSCTKNGLLEFEEGCPQYTSWNEESKQCIEQTGPTQIYYQSDTSFLPDLSDFASCPTSSFCVQDKKCYADKRNLCDKTQSFKTTCEEGEWKTTSPPCTSQDQIVNDALWLDYYNCFEGRCLSKYVSCGCGCVNPTPWLLAKDTNQDACPDETVCTDVLSACIPEDGTIQLGENTYVCKRGDWQGLNCDGKIDVCRPQTTQTQINPSTWRFNQLLTQDTNYKFDYLISRTYPALIKFPSFTATGTIRVDVASGELEKIKELLDRTCFSGLEQKLRIKLSSPIRAQQNELIMKLENEEEKRTLDCKSSFQIKAGNYIAKVSKVGEEVKLRI